MTTIEDATGITREESVRNFMENSITTKHQAFAALDRWIDRLSRNELDIALCKESRDVLKNVLVKLRGRMMATPLPELTAYGTRYELDIFRDRVQVGVETYGDRAVFDAKGIPVFIGHDESEPEGGSDGDGEPAYDPDVEPYRTLACVPVPYWPIDTWAERNGVKPGTARQWANRGRVQAEKTDGMLRVSAIQYTPDAFTDAPSSRFRFHMPEKFPDGTVEKYPLLAGRVFDVLVTPRSQEDIEREDPDMPYAGCVISQESPSSKLSAKSWHMDADGRKAFISALYESGCPNASADKHYVSPVGDAVANPEERRPVLAPATPGKIAALDPFAASVAILSEGPAGRYEKYGEKTFEPAPRIELSFRTPDGKKGLSLEGHACDKLQDAPTDIMRAIFGQDGPVATIREIQYEAGIDVKHQYPWDRRILLIENMSAYAAMAPETAIAVLSMLPHIACCHALFRPSVVMFSLNTDNEKTAALLERAGYRKIRDKGARRRALWYAYAPDQDPRRAAAQRSDKKKTATRRPKA